MGITTVMMYFNCMSTVLYRTVPKAMQQHRNLTKLHHNAVFILCCYGKVKPNAGYQR